MREITNRRHVCSRSLVLSIAVSIGAMMILAACNSYEAGPFDPKELQQSARDAARKNGTVPLLPLPTTFESPVLPTAHGGAFPATLPATFPVSGTPLSLLAPGVQPTVRMSLRQILHLTAANALDVKVASYQPAIDANRITEAQAHFDPTFFTKVQFQEQGVFNPSVSNPTIDPLTQPVAFHGQTISTGFKQALTSGAQIQVNYDVNRAVRHSGPTSQPFAFFVNPFYSSDLAFQITQPLLQNFGSDINQARILIAQDTHKVSLLDFRLALEKNVGDVEEAYWQLVLAERDLNIQVTLLARTWETANRLYRRRGQDTTALELSQVNAELYARYAALSDAEAAVIKQSNKIKSLVNDPSMPSSSAAVILPGETPIETPILFDSNDQIQTALTYRAELAQQQLRINSADTTVRAAKNNLLPALNLTASIDAEGIGQSYGRAFKSQETLNNINWALGLELDIPLGNREARAIYRRTQLQRQQALVQYHNLVEKISAEVKDAETDLANSWIKIGRARKARFAAEEKLFYLEQRDPSIAGGVERRVQEQTRLQFQGDLANAQRAETEAIVGYNVAISALERAKGTILRYNNIIMAEEAQPFGSPATVSVSAPSPSHGGNTSAPPIRQ